MGLLLVLLGLIRVLQADDLSAIFLLSVQILCTQMGHDTHTKSCALDIDRGATSVPAPTVDRNSDLHQ